MLDPNLKIEKQESQKFKALPDDVYDVELLDIMLEQRPTYDTRLLSDDKKKYENVFNFQFTIISPEHRCRNFWANFIPATLYIGTKNGKNKLYQVIEALLARELTREEEASMNAGFVNALVGKHCRVFVSNYESKKGEIKNCIDKFTTKKDSFPALTDEDKEKARVKDKEDKTAAVAKEKESSVHEDSGEMSEEERARYEATFGPDQK